jgi:hypothetical protein
MAIFFVACLYFEYRGDNQLSDAFLYAGGAAMITMIANLLTWIVKSVRLYSHDEQQKV